MEFGPNDFKPYSRSFARFLLPFALLLLISPCAWPQQVPKKVDIQVHADQSQGELSPIWNYFGYDEPNYTYAVNGRKLLGELGALGAKPAYVRVHNLLTTGDGAASLKWGSTNVYTEDAAGKPVYSWTILDQIFDAFHAAGIKPLVEIGFMPEALSTHPEPYRHTFPQGSIYTGWAYPPKDYQKWSEVVFQFVHHLRERYGDAEVKTWLWEVWNEPDIDYWQGTPQEYFKLYDFSVDAVLRALPEARVGGPDSTGPANPKAAEFLRSFLDHCAHQRNYVTGKIGSRLDFISFHPKGVAEVAGRSRTDGHRAPAGRHRAGLQDRGVVSRVAPHPNHSGRVGSGRLRRLFGANQSAEFLSQRTLVRRLHGGNPEQHSFSGRPGAHRFPWRGHLGIRIRGPTLLRGLSHTGHQGRGQAGAECFPDVWPSE